MAPFRMRLADRADRHLRYSEVKTHLAIEKRHTLYKTQRSVSFYRLKLGHFACADASEGIAILDFADGYEVTLGEMATEESGERLVPPNDGEMRSVTPHKEVTNMVQEIASELIRVVDSTAETLKGIDEDAVRHREDQGKWSVKEILGHLIDSAANNHQRFVRAQEADGLVFPKYEQDHWVRAQAYNEKSWGELVELWRLYNRHLAHVIEQIPESKLAVECTIGPYEPVTLKFLIEDYFVHLKHHLEQIEGRSALGR